MTAACPYRSVELTKVPVRRRRCPHCREAVTPAGSGPAVYSYDVALGSGESAPVTGSSFVCRENGALEQRVRDASVGKL